MEFYVINLFSKSDRKIEYKKIRENNLDKFQ